MITFLVSGFWHGASWNFVIWGGISGSAVLAESVIRKKDPRGSTDKPGGNNLAPSLAITARMLLTFMIICLAWVFFRAQSFSESVLIIEKLIGDMFDISGYKHSYWTILNWSTFERPVLPILAAFILVEWVQRAHPHPLFLDHWPRPVRWGLYTVLIWTSVWLCADKNADFIYFQF